MERVINQLVDASTGIAALFDFSQNHRVGDTHTGRQRFRRSSNQAVEGIFIPHHKTLRGLLAFHFAALFGVISRFCKKFRVLNLEFRRQRNNHALGVEARTAGAPCNLVEFATAKTTHFMAVKLGELRKHHGVNGHVDANAQRVGAANYRQQPLLGKLFHQQTITRQHSGVMHANTAKQQTLQRFAKLGGKLARPQRSFDLLTLLLAGYAKARKSLRRSEGGVLREMHYVKGPFVVTQGQFYRAFERHKLVLVFQGNGARSIGNNIYRCSRFRLQGLRNLRNVSQRRAHKKELCMGKREQRNLPSPTAVGVAVEMEFVHCHATDIRPFAFAKRLVCQDLSRTTDNRSLWVDLRISRDHTHVFTPQHIHQAEKLFAYERFDGSRVERAFARAQCHEHHADGDHRLP